MGLSDVGDLKVTELMNKYILMVKPDMTVLDAMERMIEENFRCVFVVRPHPYEEMGIVTRFDIMAKVLARGINPLKITIGEIMEKGMFYIDADKTIKEACKIMGENQICHLPIKKEGRLIGIISSSDIFNKYFAEPKKKVIM
jgi:acetoin utilization protein AcuB